MPVKPVVNFNKCQGCPDCINKCHSHVLALRKITPQEITSLSLIGKQKAKKYPQKAYVVHPKNCTCCVSCEMVCKKGAIHITELQ
ncbi:MAG: 4Fe-4S dicluster domain-containing protein [Chloroflexi bacterium]|nr:4Fe-4S dicluster domain-containing protein [Chloroflexota bacterium]